MFLFSSRQFVLFNTTDPPVLTLCVHFCPPWCARSNCLTVCRNVNDSATGSCCQRLWCQYKCRHSLCFACCHMYDFKASPTLTVLVCSNYHTTINTLSSPPPTLLLSLTPVTTEEWDFHGSEDVHVGLLCWNTMWTCKWRVFRAIRRPIPGKYCTKFPAPNGRKGRQYFFAESTLKIFVRLMVRWAVWSGKYGRYQRFWEMSSWPKMEAVYSTETLVSTSKPT
jgi:hypothetical protein